MAHPGIACSIISAFFLLGSIQAQVIINEISYNPPEGGTDSLEYIELFNAGAASVNIGGWHFLAGIEDTLPDLELQPGAYFITAVNAQAMMNVYGILVHEWSSGGLNNNGEMIKLADAGGTLVDSVLYDDIAPWPGEPDGDGPSAELIDAGSDNNDGSNWQYSGGNTGVIIEGKEVMGTPGAQNSGGGTPGPDLTIDMAGFAFIPNIAVVEIGSVVRWVNNENDAHNVNGQQSDFPGNPASFFSGFAAYGPWQYEFEFTIPGTYHYQCDPHAGLGMTGIIYVFDTLGYNDFTLQELRQVNANGSALFNGVPTSVTGVVHGVNFQPTGYSFYIINQDNVGINVFSFDPGTYQVTEGDRLNVFGTIDQFNGLLEIVPDSIEVLSTGNSLTPYLEVSAISEDFESSHVFLYTFSIDSIVQTGTSGFNVYVEHEDGNKVLIRVDADSGMDIDDIFGNAVRGIGTQFDNSFPFNDGYQLLALEFLWVDGLPILDKRTITMDPNPAVNQLTFRSDILLSTIEIFSMDGRQLVRKNLNSESGELNISSLPEGMHFVKVTTDQGIWTSMLAVIRN